MRERLWHTVQKCHLQHHTWHVRCCSSAACRSLHEVAAQSQVTDHATCSCTPGQKLWPSYKRWHAPGGPYQMPSTALLQASCQLHGTAIGPRSASAGWPYLPSPLSSASSTMKTYLTKTTSVIDQKIKLVAHRTSSWLGWPPLKIVL